MLAHSGCSICWWLVADDIAIFAFKEQTEFIWINTKELNQYSNCVSVTTFHHEMSQNPQAGTAQPLWFVYPMSPFGQDENVTQQDGRQAGTGRWWDCTASRWLLSSEVVSQHVCIRMKDFCWEKTEVLFHWFNRRKSGIGIKQWTNSDFIVLVALYLRTSEPYNNTAAPRTCLELP